PMFDAGSPTFDRKGDFFYDRASNKFTSPRYADVDSSFIYAGTQQLMMVPLREDVKTPMAVRSDEEELKKDGAKPADKPGEKPADKGEKSDKGGAGDKPEGEKKDADKKDDAEHKPDAQKKE